MKKLLISAIFLITTSIFALPFVKADAKIDFNSKYFFRGVEASEGFVMNPSANVEAFGASLEIWGNYDFDAPKGMDSYNETDITVKYSQSLGLFSVTPGFVYYSYTNDGFKNTGEVSLKFSTKLPIPFINIEIYLDNYLDVIEYTGNYFGAFGVSVTSGLIPMLTLEGDLNLSWQKFTEDLDPEEEFRLNSINLSAGVSFSPVPLAYIKIHGLVSSAMDDYIKAAKDEDVTFYGGIAIGVKL